MSVSATSDVVITGVGIFSPLGIGRDAFWKNLSAGRHGFRRSEVLSYVAAPDCIGGEVPDFNDSTAKKQHLRVLRKSLKVMCRDIQLGVASAIQAMADAGLEKGSIDPTRVGVDFGANLMSSPPDVLFEAAKRARSETTGKFDFSLWGETGIHGMEPLWLLRYLPNMPGCHIGIAVDARGPNNSITHDEASSGLVLSEAANIIRRGRADVMLTGVTGTRLHPVKSCHHGRWDPLATGPAEARCRPLDRNRSGEVLAEAGCTLVLESREHAEARGATILAELKSVATGCFQDQQGTSQIRQGIAHVGQLALARADVGAGDLGHVNCGAAGHPDRDLAESLGIIDVLGSTGKDIPVTALKSYLGSAGSGSAMSEIAASIIALRAGVIPKTLNFESCDDGAELNVVHGSHLETSNKLFLKTSVSRQGQAAAVVINVC